MNILSEYLDYVQEGWKSKALAGIGAAIGGVAAWVEIRNALRRYHETCRVNCRSKFHGKDRVLCLLRCDLDKYKKEIVGLIASIKRTEIYKRKCPSLAKQWTKKDEEEAGGSSPNEYKDNLNDCYHRCDAAITYSKNRIVKLKEQIQIIQTKISILLKQ